MPVLAVNYGSMRTERNKMNLSCLTAFVIAISCLVEGKRGYQGKEFILSFMDNRMTGGHYDKLFVTNTENTSVFVKIASPKWNDMHLPKEFTLPAGHVQEISIGMDLRMKETGLSTKGILITATHDVGVYGVNTVEGSTDAFLGLPTNVLGSSYYAVTYSGIYLTEFLIAVAEHSTLVNIRLSNNPDAKSVTYDGTTYKPGDNITLLMNPYDTFQIQSSGDLTGIYVTSTKPITFFSGNVFTSIGYTGIHSHLVEQLTTVEAWGYRFAMISTPYHTSGDYFKIITSLPETDLKYTCNHEGKTSTNCLQLDNSGDSTQIHVGPETYCFLESSNPILVIQFALGCGSPIDTDPTMIMVPNIEQYTASYTFTTPKTSEAKEFRSLFMFIIDRPHIQGLRLNGHNISNMVYRSIPTTNLFDGYFDVPDGTHTVRQTSDVGFSGILYGQSYFESYGFSVGLHLTEPDITESRRLECGDDNSVKSGEFQMIKRNVDIKSGVIWQKGGIASMSMCASLCVLDCKCKGFTYHKEKQICRGHGKLTCSSLDNKLNTTEDGFSYMANI